MDKHREELLKRYIGEESFTFLVEEVSRYWDYLESEISHIHNQKTNGCITPKQAEALIKDLFKELELYNSKTFPKLISELKVDLFYLDTEQICYEFCNILFVRFNDIYLEKFRKK